MRDNIRNNAILSIELLITVAFFIIFFSISIGISNRAREISADNADSSMALNIAIRMAEEFKGKEGDLTKLDIADANDVSISDNTVDIMYTVDKVWSDKPTNYKCTIEVGDTLYNISNSSYKEATITVYRIEQNGLTELVKLDSAVISSTQEEEI